MKMTSRNLAIDEYILLRSRRHWLFWALLATAALIGLFHSLPLLVGAGLVALDQSGYCLVITNRKMVEQRGLVFRRIRTLRLNQLSTMDMVSYGLPLLATLGSLTVKTHTGTRHRFHWMPRPEQTVRLLDSLRADTGRTSTIAPLPRPSNSLAHLVR